MQFRGDRHAFGAPGIDPRWEHGDKIGAGTAYSGDSKIWYTLWRGIVTEVYYPLVDHPQLRDLQFLISDGGELFHEERRHLVPTVTNLDPVAPGYRVVTADPEGRYSIEKEVLAAPHYPVLLQQVQLRRAPGFDRPLQLYLLAAPHLDVGGMHNNGYVVEAAGHQLLVAERNGLWLALGASRPFTRLSCGYVGSSDGWTDIAQHRWMTWEFDRATDGNLALTGELGDPGEEPFTVGLGFGRGASSAVTCLLQALGVPYAAHRARFLTQWGRTVESLKELTAASSDGGHLARLSHSTILTHEDKTFPGAFIASLAIPWGNAKNDSDRGGYHLVWTRDLCEIAAGLLAVGNRETPLRTLIYLASSQNADGGFPQNSWVNGEPYWGGVQLDEVSFPILLAEKLHRENALENFDPYPMVLRAARFLVENGPATGQDRWEEASGYSPSTLAAHISALVVAGQLSRVRGDPETATFLEENADFLEGHLERWTVTSTGTLLTGHPRHFMRIFPVRIGDSSPDEDPETARLALNNQSPEAPPEYPAKEIVDAGFLELVRYGVRSADDPLVVASLAVVDAVLKVHTPFGPCWRRYNHDGYGQTETGEPFLRSGVGRAWPLLTGERGHYELGAGRDARPYLRAMERFASPTGLLPEQVWDEADLPEKHLQLGRSTGAAMPLLWAHAEYMKLLRSAVDGRVFDRVPAVEARYANRRGRPPCRLEIWKYGRQPSTVPTGCVLRVQSSSPFRLHWSTDGWRTVQDTDSHSTQLGISFVDLDLVDTEGPVVFTFFWPGRNAWEGRDYRVAIQPAADDTRAVAASA